MPKEIHRRQQLITLSFGVSRSPKNKEMKVTVSLHWSKNCSKVEERHYGVKTDSENYMELLLQLA